MGYTKGELLYEGKAKQIYSVVEDDDVVWMDFKDSLTAFNALKKGSFEGKGSVNCQIATCIFEYLESKGIETHWLSTIEGVSMVSKKVDIIPLEVVVRNIMAGSTAKKLGITDGEVIDSPLVEFFYKNDELEDPFLSDAQALYLKIAKDQNELDTIKKMALMVNDHLKTLFNSIGVSLVDFKIEFGRTSSGQMLLSDEISPDSCRLWDLSTGEKMDKDRFRKDLGDVDKYYHEILNRLKTYLSTN